MPQLMTTRTLTLIRHAKSSWGDPSFTDFERPLNKRGLADAPKVGSALKDAGLVFDRILCSDAKRAQQTLSLLRQGIDVADECVESRHDLYCASADYIYSCITDQSSNISNLALIGHNPGMEEIANSLASEVVGDMSTCCVVVMNFDCDDWAGVPESGGSIQLILKPRDL